MYDRDTNNPGHMRSTTVIRFFVAAIFSMPTASAAAQTPSARSQFVLTKGKDTVAVEVFSRTASSLGSEIYQTTGPRIQYTMDLTAAGVINHVELTRVTRAGQSFGVGLFFLDTLVKGQFTTPGGSEQAAFPTRHAVPFLAVSLALCEQIVRAERLAVGATASATAIRLGAADTVTLKLTRFHADSVLFSMPDLQMKVATNANGDVIGGINMTAGWIAERKSTK